MIKSVFLPAIFSIFFITQSAWAQKVIVIDVDNILESMDTYRQAQQRLDEMALAWNREIETKYDEIKTMYNKYQADQVLLSDDQRKEREDAIINAEKEARELQRQKFGPEGELFSRRQELINPIQDKVFAAIEKYATTRAVDIVLDKNSSTGILFVSDKYDKTEEIKKGLK